MSVVVEMSEKQVVCTAQACELLARINMGQLEYLAEALIGHKAVNVDYTAKHIAACACKQMLFGLESSANLGIHNPDVPEIARVAWDLAKVLRGQDIKEKTSVEELATARKGMFPTVGRRGTLSVDFAKHAGRTMFVLQWADYEEHAGRCHGGCEFFNVAPETPGEFIAEGWKYLGALEHVNHMSLLMLLRRAAMADGKPENAYWNTESAEAFASGCTMSAAGHGCSWFDSHKHWEEFKNIHLDSIPELDPVEYPELEEPDA